VETLSPQGSLECLEDEFRSQDLEKAQFLMDIGYDDWVDGDVGKTDTAMASIEYAKAKEQLAELFIVMQEVHPGLKYWRETYDEN
jgi:hypothetical protein